MTGKPWKRSKPIPKHLRGATPGQLWVLNDQGVLVVAEHAEEPFPPHERTGTPILNSEADKLIQRLLAERYPGLLGFPKKGQVTVLRDGVVRIVGEAE